MILVRQPHCWRFLYPLGPGMPEPTRERIPRQGRCASSARSTGLEILNTIVYRIHHRIATRVAARSRVPDGRRGAPDHADVGARAQYRHSRRHQPAVAARLGGARLGGSTPCSTAMRASSGRSRPKAPARWRKPRASTWLGQNDAVKAMSGDGLGQCADPHHAGRAARRRSVRRLVDGARPSAGRCASASAFPTRCCTGRTAVRCGCTT